MTFIHLTLFQSWISQNLSLAFYATLNRIPHLLLQQQMCNYISCAFTAGGDRWLGNRCACQITEENSGRKKTNTRKKKNMLTVMPEWLFLLQTAECGCVDPSMCTPMYVCKGFAALIYWSQQYKGSEALVTWDLLHQWNIRTGVHDEHQHFTKTLLMTHRVKCRAVEGSVTLERIWSYLNS